MSRSDSIAPIGIMTGLLRTAALKRRSCSATYTAFCPASFGQSGLVLLPLGPWQAMHVATLVAPLCTVPSVYGSTGAFGASAAPAQVGRLISAARPRHAAQPHIEVCDILISAPERFAKAANCTLAAHDAEASR